MRTRLKTFTLLVATAALALACAAPQNGVSDGTDTARRTRTDGADTGAAPNPNAAPQASATAAAPAVVAPAADNREGQPQKASAAPKSQIGSGGNDFFLFTSARGALKADGELKDADITLDVSEGVVTLKGGVASAAQKARAEQVVRAIKGVKEVRNQLGTSARSPAKTPAG